MSLTVGHDTQPGSTAPGGLSRRRVGSSFLAPKMLGAAVAFLGATVLVSWYGSSLNALRPEKHEAVMSYSTALGFVLAGLAVMCHCFGRPRLAFWGGVLAAGLGSMSLAENLLGRSLHVVRSLFGGAFVLPEQVPMSPVTALGFALTGCLLVTWRAPRSSQRWRRLAIGTLAACIVATGFVGLLAFVVSDGSSYGWAQLTLMEAHTALGFVGLGAAFFLMLTRLREAPEAAGLPGWAAWTVSLGVVALTVTLWTSLTTTDARLSSVAAMRSHEAAVAHTNQALQLHLRTLERAARAVGTLPEPPQQRAALLEHEISDLVGELPGLTGAALLATNDTVEWTDGRRAAAELEASLAGRQELQSALRLARDEGLVAVSDPASIFGFNEDFFVVVPLGAADAVGRRPVLLFEHQVQPFFSWLVGAGVDRALDVELATAEGRSFFQTPGHVPADSRAAPAGDSRLTTGQVAFGDKLWTVSGVGDRALMSTGKNAGNTLILWFGLFLAVALGVVIRKSELVRQRAASLAEANRTIERNAASLEQANASLESQAMHLRATESQLLRTAREKRRVLDSLSAVLIGVDGDGRVVEWNSVASQLFGLGDGDALGRPFEELPLNWNRAQVAEAVRECVASG